MKKQQSFTQNWLMAMTFISATKQGFSTLELQRQKPSPEIGLIKVQPMLTSLISGMPV